MTLQDLRYYAFSLLDDQDGIATGIGGYFTNTQLDLWLNLALFEVQKQLIEANENWYIKCATTTSVANQREYALPADFLSSIRLEFVLSGTGVNENVNQLIPITLNQQNMFGKVAGNPKAYVVMKDSFLLFPAPNSANTMELWYNKKIEPMSLAQDVPDVPSQYQEYIAILACYNGFIKDDRVPSVLETKKQQYLDLIKKAAESRQHDFSRSVRCYDDETSGFYW